MSRWAWCWTESIYLRDQVGLIGLFHFQFWTFHYGKSSFCCWILFLNNESLVCAIVSNNNRLRNQPGMHLLCGIISPVEGADFRCRNWGLYLSFLLKEVSSLHQGVSIFNAATNQHTLVRGTLLMTSTDSRAFPKVANLTTAPAIHGACPRCYVVGHKQYKNTKFPTTYYTGHHCFLPRHHGLRTNVSLLRLNRLLKEKFRKMKTLSSYMRDVVKSDPKSTGVKGLDSISPLIKGYNP